MNKRTLNENHRKNGGLGRMLKIGDKIIITHLGESIAVIYNGVSSGDGHFSFVGPKSFVITRDETKTN